MLCCLCRGRGCVQCSGTQSRSSNAALEKFLHKVEIQHDSCGIPTTRIVILGSKASVPVQERIKSVGCRESCTSACRFALLSFMVVNIKFSCVPDFELAGLLFGWFVERSLLPSRFPLSIFSLPLLPALNGKSCHAVVASAAEWI